MAEYATAKENRNWNRKKEKSIILLQKTPSQHALASKPESPLNLS